MLTNRLLYYCSGYRLLYWHSLLVQIGWAGVLSEESLGQGCDGGQLCDSAIGPELWRKGLLTHFLDHFDLLCGTRRIAQAINLSVPIVLRQCQMGTSDEDQVRQGLFFAEELNLTLTNSPFARLLMTVKLWVRHYAAALNRDADFQAQLKQFSTDALQGALSDPELQLINSFHYAPPPEREEDITLRKRLLLLPHIGEGDTMFDSSKHDPRALASQLSLLNSKLMALIDSSELINGACLDPVRSPTYTAMVDFINRVTNWVAFEILCRHNVAERVRILGYFIEVSRICVQNNDYNGAWAVFGAFGLHQVSRLTATWEVRFVCDLSSALWALLTLAIFFVETVKERRVQAQEVNCSV